MIPFLCAIAFLLALLLISPRVMNAFASKVGTPHENIRQTVWKAAVRSFKKKPILGHGLGSFERVYRLYKEPIETNIGRYEKTTAFAHSEPLQIAVETGLLGLCSFLGIVLTILRDGFHSLKTGEWKKRAAMVSILALLFHSLVDFNLHLPILAFLLVFFSSTVVQTQNGGIPWIQKRGIKRFLKPALISWIAMDILGLCSHSFASIANSKKHKQMMGEAVFFYKAAAALFPGSADTAKNLAALVQNEEAEKILKKALWFDPGDDTLHAALARIYFFRNDDQNAVKEFQNAIANNPKNPFYYTELAEIPLRKRNLGEALRLYHEAAGLEPFYAFAHFRSGEIYLLTGDRKAALGCFEAVKKIRDFKLLPQSDYAKRLLDFDFSLAQKRISGLEELK